MTGTDASVSAMAMMVIGIIAARSFTRNGRLKLLRRIDEVDEITNRPVSAKKHKSPTAPTTTQRLIWSLNSASTKSESASVENVSQMFNGASIAATLGSSTGLDVVRIADLSPS